jgi:hypothetical protein
MKVLRINRNIMATTQAFVVYLPITEKNKCPRPNHKSEQATLTEGE